MCICDNVKTFCKIIIIRIYNNKLMKSNVVMVRYYFYKRK